ncbi:MAG: rhomboid family intramembrane serine protease [Bacteroidia bacterium]
MGIALAAFHENNWQVNAIDENSFYAFTNPIEEAPFSVILCEWKDKTLFIRSESGDGTLFDKGRNLNYVERFKKSFWLLKEKGSEEEYTELFRTYKDSIPIEELSLDEGRIPDENPSAITDILAFFVPRKDYFITPILIDINILVFIGMLISGVSLMQPSSADVYNWGGVFRPAVLNGEWYRIITAFFVHIGLLHLLMNMFALVMVAPQLELLLGKWRFGIAYFFCGILASCTSLWWHPGTVGAGASGAIFGLYGLFLALLGSNLLDKRIRKPLLSSIGIFVVYNLAFGLKDGVDNAAHIGGLLSGIIAGYSFYFGLRFATNRFYQWKLPLISMLLTLVVALYTVSNLPDHYGEYEMMMNRFQQLEEKAISSQRNIQGKDQQIATIVMRDQIIPQWEQCAEIADSLLKLDLDQPIKKRNELIFFYTQNRLIFFKTMYKASFEQSRKYDHQIDSLSKSNELILKKIKEM